MSEDKVEAFLSLRRDGRSLVGRDRIDLLEAVETHGSITKAAKAVGLSYKAAWDALNTVNNLLPKPAIVGQTGGRHGGGAAVTDQGKALIASFRLLEERLARVTEALTSDATKDNGSAPDPLTLLWSLGMKTSARNVFHCEVEDVDSSSVNAKVKLRLTPTNSLTAVITRESVQDLDIQVGRRVVALVKSSFVVIASCGDPMRLSARNQVRGTVINREDGPVNTEITLDIGDGKTISAVITHEAAEELALKEGDDALALFKASHVILAVD